MKNKPNLIDMKKRTHNLSYIILFAKMYNAQIPSFVDDHQFVEIYLAHGISMIV